MNIKNIIVIIIIIILIILLFILLVKFKKFNLFGSENVIQGVNDEGLYDDWYYVNNINNEKFKKLKNKCIESGIIDTSKKYKDTPIIYFGKWIYWKLHIAFPKNIENREKVIKIVNQVLNNYSIAWKFHQRYNKMDFVPIQSMKEYLELLNQVKLADNECKAKYETYNKYNEIRMDINDLKRAISNKNIDNIKTYESKSFDMPLVYECMKNNVFKYKYYYSGKFNEESQKLFDECTIKDIIERAKINKSTSLDIIHLNLLCKGCDIVIDDYFNSYKKFRNNANTIEASKLITIYSTYPDSISLDEIASLLNYEFKKENIEFHKIYSEFKIYDGIYTRLSENVNEIDNKLNRYTPLISEKIIIGYTNSIKYNYKNENIKDVGKYDDIMNIIKNLTVRINDEEIKEIEHPFNKLYYFDINDNEIELPKKLIDINKCLINEFGNELKFDDVDYI
jgi:hypothetical protein